VTTLRSFLSTTIRRVLDPVLELPGRVARLPFVAFFLVPLGRFATTVDRTVGRISWAEWSHRGD
jgi:hypothetical protein